LNWTLINKNRGNRLTWRINERWRIELLRRIGADKAPLRRPRGSRSLSVIWMQNQEPQIKLNILYWIYLERENECRNYDEPRVVGEEAHRSRCEVLVRFSPPPQYSPLVPIRRRKNELCSLSVFAITKPSQTHISCFIYCILINLSSFS
jgi:hypothetical protein